MSNTDIPAILCGRHAGVVRQWRRVAKRAVALGSIVEAVADLEFVPIDETPGNLILAGDGGPLVEGENVILYPAVDELLDAVQQSCGEDHARWVPRWDAMVVPALDHFWFALSALAPQGRADAHLYKHPEKAEKSLVLLRKLVRWWPEFCKLDDRFSEGMALPQNGYRWGRATWGLVRNMGMTDAWIRELQFMDPEEARERFVDLIIDEGRKMKRGE